MTTPSDDLRATRPRLLLTTLALAFCVLIASGAADPDAGPIDWQWMMVGLTVVVFGLAGWTMVYLLRSDV